MMYSTDAVILAAGVTALIVFFLTIFAFQVSWMSVMSEYFFDPHNIRQKAILKVVFGQ